MSDEDSEKDDVQDGAESRAVHRSLRRAKTDGTIILEEEEEDEDTSPRDLKSPESGTLLSLGPSRLRQLSVNSTNSSIVTLESLGLMLRHLQDVPRQLQRLQDSVAQIQSVLRDHSSLPHGQPTTVLRPPPTPSWDEESDDEPGSPLSLSENTLINRTLQAKISGPKADGKKKGLNGEESMAANMSTALRSNPLIGTGGRRPSTMSMMSMSSSNGRLSNVDRRTSNASDMSSLSFLPAPAGFQNNSHRPSSANLLSPPGFQANKHRASNASTFSSHIGWEKNGDRRFSTSSNTSLLSTGMQHKQPPKPKTLSAVLPEVADENNEDYYTPKTTRVSAVCEQEEEDEEEQSSGTEDTDEAESPKTKTTDSASANKKTGDWSLRDEDRTSRADALIAARKSAMTVRRPSLDETMSDDDDGTGSKCRKCLKKINPIRIYRTHFPIMHDSGPRLFWDVLMVFIVLFMGLLLPVQLTYMNGVGVADEWNAIYIIVDSLWIIDICLGFGTVRRSDSALLIEDLDEIARDYAGSWLAVDAISAWPLALSPGASGTTFFRWHVVLKMFKILKLCYWIPSLQEQLRSVPLWWTKLALPFIIVSHAFTCLWRFSLERDDTSLLEAAPTSTDYISDMYWVMMTITTVGYGDIVPSGPSGQVYAIVVMLASSIFSGVVVASTSEFLSKIFDNQTEVQVQSAIKLMHVRGVNGDVIARVEHGLRHQLKQQNDISPPKLLEKLSPALQRELALELLQNVLRPFPLFQNAPSAFLSQLAQAHSWVLALAGDLVVEEGQVEEELVFLVRGSLLRLQSAQGTEVEDGGKDLDNELVVEELLRPGAWFGEISLFEDEIVRMETVIADTDVEMAILPGAEFLTVLKHFPRLLKQHRTFKREILFGQKDTTSLRWRPPSRVSQSSGGAIFFKKTARKLWRCLMGRKDRR